MKEKEKVIRLLKYLLSLRHEKNFSRRHADFKKTTAESDCPAGLTIWSGTEGYHSSKELAADEVIASMSTMSTAVSSAPLHITQLFCTCPELRTSRRTSDTVSPR